MTNKTSIMIQSMRDELRDRRLARAEYRALKSALASFDTPAEIDDLLLTAEAHGEDTEVVREILADNRRRYHITHNGDVSAMGHSA